MVWIYVFTYIFTYIKCKHVYTSKSYIRNSIIWQSKKVANLNESEKYGQDLRLPRAWVLGPYVGKWCIPIKRWWYCMKASLASGIEDLVSFIITLFRALFVLSLLCTIWDSSYWSAARCRQWCLCSTWWWHLLRIYWYSDFSRFQFQNLFKFIFDFTKF